MFKIYNTIFVIHSKLSCYVNHLCTIDLLSYQLIHVLRVNVYLYLKQLEDLGLWSLSRTLKTYFSSHSNLCRVCVTSYTPVDYLYSTRLVVATPNNHAIPVHRFEQSMLSTWIGDHQRMSTILPSIYRRYNAIQYRRYTAIRCNRSCNIQMDFQHFKLQVSIHQTGHSYSTSQDFNTSVVGGSGIGPTLDNVMKSDLKN